MDNFFTKLPRRKFVAELSRLGICGTEAVEDSGDFRRGNETLVSSEEFGREVTSDSPPPKPELSIGCNDVLLNCGCCCGGGTNEDQETEVVGSEMVVGRKKAVEVLEIELDGVGKKEGVT